MKWLLRAAFLAALGMGLSVSPAQAGTFGLFTKSFFTKSCIYCNCEKPYNAFTPPGYYVVVPVTAGSPGIMAGPVGNSPFDSVVTSDPNAASPATGGCSSCGTPAATPAPAVAPAEPTHQHFLHRLRDRLIEKKKAAK